MNGYCVETIKDKIDRLPIIAVKDGIIISSSADQADDSSLPRSGQWIAEVFSSASSLVFSPNSRKSGIISLCRGRESREELLFFDRFLSGSSDGSRVTILCGEDPTPSDMGSSMLLPSLSDQIDKTIGDILTEGEKNSFINRYKAISSCFRYPGMKSKKKKASSPLHLIESLNKVYKKKFKTEPNAISTRELSPEARRAELFLSPEVLCAIIFLSVAFLTRCIISDPTSPGIKSHLIFEESSATLKFSAVPKDIGYFSFDSSDPLDVRKGFPSFSGEFAALSRLCNTTECEFSLSVDDKRASLSYKFPAFIKRRRIRAYRESESMLKFFDILADFIL